MKIVVLAAGNSSERDVSIVSGTGVCSALRSLGHRAILVDAYFGCDDLPEEHFPEEYDAEAEARRIRSKSAGLEEEMQKRRSFSVRMYWIYAGKQILFSSLFTARTEKTGVCRPLWICWA